MAGISFTTQSIPVSDNNFSGGLNSTAGALGLNNTESSDLQNIDFNKFGSILSRNGYTALNTSAIATSPQGDGLHWFEYDSSGTTTRFAVKVAGAKLWKMDALDGTWDDVTGALTITATHQVDFENWLNEVYMTNGVDVPFKWTGSGNGAAMTVPTGLTKAKFVRQFNNYLFLANVTVSGTAHPSRIYYSNLKTTGTWTATDFIEVSKNDGQEITGIKVLSDRLVIFKSRSIYNLFFTGDADIPFILPGGGKSNSPVGCVAPFSIQEIENGLVFLSYDGLYFYDGNSSYKISDKISATILGLNTSRLPQCRSLTQKGKNRYWLSCPNAGSTTNNRVIVWDWFNNAFSIYTGIAASAMTTFYVDGLDERPYFSDYAGFTYRADTGDDDYPLNVRTAINSYYYTNWRHNDDLVDQKATPHVTIYHQISSTTLSFSYSFDFENADQYTQLISLNTSTSVYGTAKYGTGMYARSGGAVKRKDLTGRGLVTRYKFANNILGERFQIDGLGTLPHLEKIA